MRHKFKTGDHVIFSPTDSDRAGRTFLDVVIRRLTSKERDAEVGPMYQLRDWGDAFEDELERVAAIAKAEGRGE